MSSNILCKLGKPVKERIKNKIDEMDYKISVKGGSPEKIADKYLKGPLFDFLQKRVGNGDYCSGSIKKKDY